MAKPGREDEPFTPEPRKAELRLFTFSVRNGLVDLAVGELKASSEAEARKIVVGWLTDGLTVGE